MNKKWYFILGLLTGLIVMPLSTLLGVPRFSDLLETVFGDQKLFAFIFIVTFVTIIGLFLYGRREKTE